MNAFLHAYSRAHHGHRFSLLETKAQLGGLGKSLGVCQTWSMAGFEHYIRTGLAVGALVWLTQTAIAQDVTVDLELVLAVDVSLSMDIDEQRLQRDGYAGAFRHRDVIDAIKLGGWGKIAVTYVEWAGQGLQRVVVPWTVVDGAQTASAFASKLGQAEPAHMFRTSISDGVLFASKLFDNNGFKGLRRVIDVSGDGPNNQGIGVTSARDEVVAKRITINGLPIMLKRSSRFGFFDLPNLDQYYEDCVIGGFGAFIISVRDKKEFAQAIRRKLVLEIAGAQPRVIKAQAKPGDKLLKRPRVDCFIGEKLWQRWRSNRDDF